MKYEGLKPERLTPCRPCIVYSMSDRKPLSAYQLDIINWIEQRWSIDGKFPPVDEFKKKFGNDFILEEHLGNDTFIIALRNRGIEISVINPYAPPDGLTTEQVAAVSLILDHTDRRSRAAKLKSLGISSVKWNGWMKNPVFKDYVHTLSAQIFGDSIDLAQEGLLKSVERGDTNAIKLYYELTGRHTADSGTVQNLKIVLARIVESVSRHVKDPEVLRAISSDFETIMAGGVPEAIQPAELDRLI